MSGDMILPLIAFLGLVLAWVIMPGRTLTQPEEGPTEMEAA